MRCWKGSWSCIEARKYRSTIWVFTTLSRHDNVWVWLETWVYINHTMSTQEKYCHASRISDVPRLLLASIATAGCWLPQCWLCCCWSFLECWISSPPWCFATIVTIITIDVLIGINDRSVISIRFVIFFFFFTSCFAFFFLISSWFPSWFPESLSFCPLRLYPSAPCFPFSHLSSFPLPLPGSCSSQMSRKTEMVAARCLHGLSDDYLRI